MEKAKALAEAKQVYYDSLVKIEAAEKFCAKIDPLLPKGWHSAYGADSGQLEFCKREKANAIEFRVVCDLVEKVTGCKLSRGIGNSGYLYGWAWHWFTDHKNMDIRVELGRPEGCKITYKRKWTKELVVDEACLGIRKAPEVK